MFDYLSDTTIQPFMKVDLHPKRKLPKELRDIPGMAEAAALVEENVHTPEGLQKYERFWEEIWLLMQKKKAGRRE